jgi:hypothetical protein
LKSSDGDTLGSAFWDCGPDHEFSSGVVCADLETPAHNAVAPAINVNMVLSFLVAGALITSPIEDSGHESKTKLVRADIPLSRTIVL